MSDFTTTRPNKGHATQAKPTNSARSVTHKRRRKNLRYYTQIYIKSHGGIVDNRPEVPIVIAKWCPGQATDSTLREVVLHRSSSSRPALTCAADGQLEAYRSSC